jgi:hypothetical protein
MRTSRRTDSGWIEADAAVALLVMALTALAAAEAGFAAERAGRALGARAELAIESGNENARLLVEAGR